MRQYARLVAMGMAAVAASATLSASVLDEAKFWWKFGQGGADGAVVQTSEIHDCRDASVGEATRVCGPSGGPIWTNMTVRLPYQQKDVECTALNIQVVPNAAGTQIRPSMVDITNGHVHSDTVTFFARICAGEQLYTGTVDRFLYNNAFRWGSTKGDSYGNLFGIRTNGTRYSPEFFIGQESAYFENIFVDPGKWYDLAFSISVVTNVTTTTVANDTTNVVQRVLCVLAGEDGLFYRTLDKPYRRTSAFTETTGRIGGQRRSVPGQRTREQLLENEQTSLQCESYREAEHTRYVCLQETLPPFQFIRHHQPA